VSEKVENTTLQSSPGFNSDEESLFWVKRKITSQRMNTRDSPPSKKMVSGDKRSVSIRKLYNDGLQRTLKEV
jgi:hypothetical protein